MPNEFDAIAALLQHNRWATERLLDVCASLTEPQFTQQFNYGPGSIHDTMLHIIGAMRRWSDLLADQRLRPALEEEPRTRNPEELRGFLAEADADLQRVAEHFRGERLLQSPRQLTVRGAERTIHYTASGALLHITTHGMHHRAQAVLMLRELDNVDVPDLDVIEWELSLT